MIGWLRRKAASFLLPEFEFRDGQFVRRWPSAGSDDITTAQSLGTVAVLRCATLIAGAIASLPVDVFRKEGGRRVAVDHPYEDLLNRETNPEMDAFMARFQMLMSFLLWGNCWNIKATAGERVVALWPVNPERVSASRDERTNDLIWEVSSSKGAPKNYPAGDILHVPWITLPGAVVGINTIQAASETVKRAQGIEKQSGKFIRNGVRPSVVFKHPGKLGEKGLKNLRESIEVEYAGPDNTGRPLILEEGMEASAIQVNPKDAQVIEQEQLMDERIAMLFGVPPHMIGLVSKTTSWGTGIGEQKQGFMDFTLAPIVNQFEHAMNRQLFSDKEKRSRLYIRHNLSAFLRADVAARYNAYVSAVSNGIMNRNEARGLEDMEPYEGGDIYTIQQQNIPVEMAGKHLTEKVPVTK